MNKFAEIISVIVLLTLVALVFLPMIILEFKMFVFFGISLKWLVGQYTAIIFFMILKALIK